MNYYYKTDKPISDILIENDVKFEERDSCVRFMTQEIITKNITRLANEDKKNFQLIDDMIRNAPIVVDYVSEILEDIRDSKGKHENQLENWFKEYKEENL